MRKGCIHVTDEILTIKEVARFLKLAEKTLYRLASEGKLPGFKVGGSWRFARADIEQWIEKQRNNPTVAENQESIRNDKK